MKGYISFLLLAFVLLECTGCGSGRTQTQEGIAVSFYYLSCDAEQLETQETVTSETRYVTALSLRELLELYFVGPDSEELLSPFPTGTAIVDIQSSSDSLTLIMSEEFFTLSGIEMTIAGCCLCNTVCEYTGMDAVILVDAMETICMEVRPEQFVTSSSLQENSGETYTIYFADSDSRYLIAETREAILSENETAMAYLMRKLQDGPESSQLSGIIPEGTELLGISLDDGVCTLNFSQAFYDNRTDDTYGAYMTIYGITNTLTGLDDVEAVRFLIEGEPLESYGVFSLAEPLTQNANAIGPVRTAGGEVDINIFVCSTDGQIWFAVPCRVKQTVSEPLAYAVTTQILDYEPPAGFSGLIPEGTQVLNISVSGSICYVDLSEEFIPNENTEEAEWAAVQALVLSLTDLDDISAVVLTIEGESAGLHYVDISLPLTAESMENIDLYR